MFVEPEGFRRNKERFNLYSFREYYQDLLESKEEYAKNIGADWIFFDDLKKVEEFQEKFSIDTIYNAINLYTKWGLPFICVNKTLVLQRV